MHSSLRHVLFEQPRFPILLCAVKCVLVGKDIFPRRYIVWTVGHVPVSIISTILQTVGAEVARATVAFQRKARIEIEKC